MDCARGNFLRASALAWCHSELTACYDEPVTRFGLCVAGAILLTGISHAQKTRPANSAHGCGALSGQVLRCFQFGFIYNVPFGWVDRTAEMAAPQDESSGGAAKPETLLAVFERPPGATADTINSAVVIASESLKDYPSVKSAADYFGPVTDLAEKAGFTIVSEPDEFAIGTKKLVRANYTKARGSLTMFQSTLVMIDKGEIVSFTFVGGNEEEVDGLIDKLKFGPTSLR